MISKIEISKQNLIHNFLEFRKLLPKNTKIVSVLKADAYGHDISIVAPILNFYTDFFQVDDIVELRKIRLFTQKPVLVLGYVEKQDLEELVWLNGILGVYDVEQIKALSAIGLKYGIKVPVHLTLDSHFGREGMLIAELPAFLQKIKDYVNIEIQGFYSHFSDANDSADDKHMVKQLEDHERAKSILKFFGYINLLEHISSSGSSMLLHAGTKKSAHQSSNLLVRLGLALYGVWPSQFIQDNFQNVINLKPVLSWKTIIAQIKTLPEGYQVGYSCTYQAPRELKVALIPIGYSDGINRLLSNTGDVLIHNTKCRILGRVSMNMMVVDISHLKNVKIEDEVVIIGQQGNQIITANDIAAKTGTIGYEVLVNINSRLPRELKEAVKNEQCAIGNELKARN